MLWFSRLTGVHGWGNIKLHGNFLEKVVWSVTHISNEIRYQITNFCYPHHNIIVAGES